MIDNGEAPPKTELPSSVERFFAFVASQSVAYGNNLNYRERDRIKTDMMNCPSRWRGLKEDQIRSGCLTLGMAKEDSDEIASFRQRVIDGHRLRPSYDKDFVFENKCIDEFPPESIRTSSKW